MKEALESRDCLYTVVEKHPGGTLQVRVVGSIVEYLFSPDDPEVVVERMAAEATRIVSLTITEGGYVADANDPDVAHDLESGEAPRTAFGLIVEAVHRRRGRGLAAPRATAAHGSRRVPRGLGALRRARRGRALRRAYRTALTSLHEHGARTTIERLGGTTK